jgi:1-acyl-sn-glycerol-3-phosphate acyltransferase
MLECIERGWRVCATGLCFLIFGAGGLLLRLLVFPLIRLMIWDRQRQILLARTVIHWTFRAFIALMRALGVMSYEVHGLEKLQRQGLLILANHPTLIDIVFLMAFVRRADCIVKAALARNPFTRGPVRAAGLVCNDAGADLIADCIASLRAGGNLIVFPEGTRTPRDQALRWQRGAANVAVRGGIDVTPVRIRVSQPLLGKGERWYHVPRRRAHFVFEIDNDIRVDRFLDENAGNKALAARRLTDKLVHVLSPETVRAIA